MRTYLAIAALRKPLLVLCYAGLSRRAIYATRHKGGDIYIGRWNRHEAWRLVRCGRSSIDFARGRSRSWSPAWSSPKCLARAKWTIWRNSLAVEGKEVNNATASLRFHRQSRTDRGDRGGRVARTAGEDRGGPPRGMGRCHGCDAASSHVVSLGTEGISARATKDAASPHRHRSADARQSYPATSGRSFSAR